MHKNKGQALVEFIVIIPIFMFIVIGMIDFGNILYQKYELENILDTVTDMYKQEKFSEINSYLSDKEVVLSYDAIEDTETIKLSKAININTPGLNLVLKNPFIINVERVIYNEK